MDKLICSDILFFHSPGSLLGTPSTAELCTLINRQMKNSSPNHLIDCEHSLARTDLYATSNTSHTLPRFLALILFPGAGNPQAGSLQLFIHNHVRHTGSAPPTWLASGMHSFAGLGSFCSFVDGAKKCQSQPRCKWGKRIMGPQRCLYARWCARLCGRSCGRWCGRSCGH
jgi:hypothetical protein